MPPISSCREAAFGVSNSPVFFVNHLVKVVAYQIIEPGGTFKKMRHEDKGFRVRDSVTDAVAHA